MGTQQSSVVLVVKWLMIGVISTTAIVSLLVFYLAKKYSPLLEVNEAQGTVKMLGGLINVNEKAGQVKVGNIQLTAQNQTLKGDIPQAISQMKELAVVFVNGRVEVKGTKADRFEWVCQLPQDVSAGGGWANLDPSTKKMNMDFTSVPGVDCEINVPDNMNVNVVGQSGSIDVEEVLGPVTIQLDNGNVSFDPAKGAKNSFKVSVLQGLNQLKHVSDPNGVPVVINVKNGVIN